MGQARKPPPKLLPRIAILALFHVMGSLLPAKGLMMKLYLFMTLIFMGWIVVSTWDIMKSTHILHPIDEWFLRYSGLFSLLLAVALFAGAAVAFSDEKLRNVLSASSHFGMIALQFVMEIGFIGSVACIWLPKTRRHVAPHLLWRVLCCPLVLIYGAYVFLLSVGPMMTRFQS